MADRQLKVTIVGDASQLDRTFRRTSRSARLFGSEVDRAGRDADRLGRGALAATVSMHGFGRSIAFASSQFLGGAGLVYGLKAVISQASRVQEETEKTGVVFGRSAKDVQAWSKTLAQSFGIGDAAALQAAGQFGNMLRPLGYGEKAAAAMSKRLVELSADMASFNNTKPDVILEALASGLAGQVRPLRQYGVFLSIARIKEEALADGIAKNAAHLTQAQKVQAAYNIILKDTRLQQGDVARNTGSLSVAQSKLTAGVQDLESRLGTALLPTLTRYVNQAAAWLNQSQNQRRIQQDVQQAISVTATVLRDATTVVKGVTGAFGGLKNTLEFLVALKVASTMAAWTTPIRGVGEAATFSSTRVALLGRRLTSLPVRTVLTLTIVEEVIRNLVPGHKAMGADFSEPTAPDVVRKGNPYPVGTELNKAYAAGLNGAKTFGPEHGKVPLDLAKAFQAGRKTRQQQQQTRKPSAASGGVGGVGSIGNLGENTATTAAGAAAKSFQLPYSLRLEQARATNDTQDMRAARDVRDYLNRVIASGRLKGEKLLQAYELLRSTTGELTSAADKSAKQAKAAAINLPKHITGKVPLTTSYETPIGLQIEAARASLTAIKDDDVKAARRIKAAAQKALASGRLSQQAQLDALNAIIGVNDQLSGQGRAASSSYHRVSAEALTAGLGLSKAARVEAEARIAQAMAHGGRAPNGPAALGIPVGGQQITVNVHGTHDPERVANKVIEKLERKAKGVGGQRRGRHGGSKLGVH